jgi:hypothetical protein
VPLDRSRFRAPVAEAAAPPRARDERQGDLFG